MVLGREGGRRIEHLAIDSRESLGGHAGAIRQLAHLAERQLRIRERKPLLGMVQRGAQFIHFPRKLNANAGPSKELDFAIKRAQANP